MIQWSSRKTRQVLGAIFIGGLIGLFLTAILIVRSPRAHAEPYLDPQAVTYAQHGGAIAVCHWFDDNGMTSKTIGAIGAALVTKGKLTVPQASDVIIYSVLVQCDYFKSTLGALTQESSVESLV
jgi:hypothetical protein